MHASGHVEVKRTTYWSRFVPPHRLQGSRGKLRSDVWVPLPAEHSYWPEKIDSVLPLIRKDFSLTKMATILVLLSAF